MKTFREAVDEFVAGSPWLGFDHVVAVTTLQHTADELDTQVLSGKINPPLLTAFGLAYRNLLKERPDTSDDEDELTKLLREAKS